MAACRWVRVLARKGEWGGRTRRTRDGTDGLVLLLGNLTGWSRQGEGRKEKGLIVISQRQTDGWIAV